MRNSIKVKMKSLLRRTLQLIPNRIRRSLAYQISKSINYHIYDLEYIKASSLENEYRQVYKNSLTKAGDEKTDNIYKVLRHINLYSYVEDVLRREVPGDFAECGCWNGNSLFATKSFIDKHRSMRSIHVFDSFEGGLSEFKNKDLKKKSNISKLQEEKMRLQFSSSYSELKKKVEGLKSLYINKGWIPEVFNNQEERDYSFVHIDVDLYEPTIESHKYFFKRLSKGGIIICDDYGYNQFPGAASAVDEFIESLPTSSYSHFIKHSIGTSVIIK